MATLPPYKKTMENEYPLLRDILLDLNIPGVYKKVLNDKTKSGGMKHALCILGMLNNSLQNIAVRQMGRNSCDRRWKLHYSTVLHPWSSATANEKMSRDEEWHTQQWDSETLSALCQLPIRRLFADGIRSNAFNTQEVLELIGSPLANAQTVDMVKAMLATIPVNVLCTELCSLHDRLENPPFLDRSRSIGMLHYIAAMIGSRHALFTAGGCEAVPESREGSDESEPCEACITAIVLRVQKSGFLHAGLSQAMRQHQIMDLARGGSSRFALLEACASKNRDMQSALDQQLARCSYCMKLVRARSFDEVQNTKTDVLVLEKMRNLVEAHDLGITKLACAYGVTSDNGVMPILEHVERQGKLMDFVQDIYMENEELGISLAMTF